MSDPIGFENTIKPYFTPCYRAHMLNYNSTIDLWDPAVVQQRWGQINNMVQGGTMPAEGCGEGVWDTITQQQFLSDFAAWKSGTAGKGNVTFKSYPALNHLMIPGTGKSLPAEYAVPGHVDAAVVADIAQWVLALPAAPGPAGAR